MLAISIEVNLLLPMGKRWTRVGGTVGSAPVRLLAGAAVAARVRGHAEGALVPLRRVPVAWRGPVGPRRVGKGPATGGSVSPIRLDRHPGCALCRLAKGTAG